MDITVTINEKDIERAVEDLIINDAVTTIEKSLFKDEYGNYDRRVYIEAIKQNVRELLKEHKDEIVNRAVDYAGVYIGKKGFKKMVDEDQI